MWFSKAGPVCLDYGTIEQVFRDGFIFINLSVGSGAVAAFSHSRLSAFFFPRKLQIPCKGSVGQAHQHCQSVLMCLLYVMASAVHCLYIFSFGILKMGIQYQCFPKRSKTQELVLVTGSSSVLFQEKSVIQSLSEKQQSPSPCIHTNPSLYKSAHGCCRTKAGWRRIGGKCQNFYY